MSQFKVQYFQYDSYEVLEYQDCENWKSVFIGALADCEAFIKLKENKNVDF